VHGVGEQSLDFAGAALSSQSGSQTSRKSLQLIAGNAECFRHLAVDLGDLGKFVGEPADIRLVLVGQGALLAGALLPIVGIAAGVIRSGRGFVFFSGTVRVRGRPRFNVTVFGDFIAGSGFPACASLRSEAATSTRSPRSLMRLS